VNLRKGEIVCDKCKGTGSTKVKRDLTKSGPYRPTIICLKCLGGGKLDWIENIIGVRTRFFNFESFPPIKPYKPFWNPLKERKKSSPDLIFPQVNRVIKRKETKQ